MKLPSLFTVESARESTNVAKYRKMTYLRKRYLELIKSNSEIGISFIVLDDNFYIFSEEDYLFFEELGFKVTRQVREYLDKAPDGERPLTEGQRYLRYKYGRIDW